MRILVIGASGLLGHTLVRELTPYHDVYGTLHRSEELYDNDFFSKYSFINQIDVLNFSVLKGVIYTLRPDVILNCAGITRRKINNISIEDTIEINACIPHKLAKFAAFLNIRVIHFSTDCVFDGKIGNYKETDLTTAEDIYGRTKALGEIITYNNCLTLRSSFIGQELFDKTELLDWFLSQKGSSIRGFRRTLYSGVSTIYMTKVVKKIIEDYPHLFGLYQLAPKSPISKFDLLNLAKEIFGIQIEIIPDDLHIHKPTLNGTKLSDAIGIVVPDWNKMLEELAEHRLEYI